jgi:hypothetical protein
MIYARHGDVHIVKINSIPSDAKEIDSLVVEEGEVTGHAHRLAESGARIWVTKNGARFIRVVTPVEISHEEHETRVIPPGDWEIRRTRETDHMQGVTRILED